MSKDSSFKFGDILEDPLLLRFCCLVDGSFIVVDELGELIKRVNLCMSIVGIDRCVLILVLLFLFISVPCFPIVRPAGKVL